VDDRLVDPSQTHDVTRTLNPPTEIRRVLVPDQPWETLGFIFYSSVVDAGDELKLFYGSYSYDQKMERHFCLATSQDGLNWTRPKLGVSTFEGSAENNLVSSGAFDGAVFIDPVAPSEKRYRLLASGGMATPETGGLFVESSPDGIRWTKTPARVLPFLPDSQHAAFYDPQRRKYVAFLRSWALKPVRPRQMSRIEVEDLETPWPYRRADEPLMIWYKDMTPTLSTSLCLSVNRQ
jgi:hypothetical protein